jgi:hypothetical protein
LDFAKDALNWGVSYLERCHTGQGERDELYALVGDVNKEFTEWWGRPEDITFHRPAYAVTRANPGENLIHPIIPNVVREDPKVAVLKE